MNSWFSLLAQVEETTPWYMNPLLIYVLTTAVIIVLSIFVGRMIARAFRSPDHDWKVSTILGTFLVALTLVFAGYYDSEEKSYKEFLPLKLGVDLKGGVTIIGELDSQVLNEGETAIKITDIIPKLLERIDPSGTREIVIRPLGDYQMEVTIPDVSKAEADRIWERLTQTGQLLFRIVVDSDHERVKTAAKAMMDQGDFNPEVKDREGEIIGKWYKIARVRNDDGTVSDESPFKFVPTSSLHYIRSSTGGLVDIREVEEFTRRLNPEDPEFNIHAGRALAYWAKNRGYPELELLMIEPPGPEDPFNVEGKHLKNSKRTTDSKGNIAIGFDMKRDGTRRMMRLTTKHQGELMAIILEGKVHTAPNLRSTISSSGIIEGNFTKEEVADLTTTLNSGKIDVAMNKNPISVDFVEPNLGKELKQKGFLAIGISFVLVILFMVFYYRFSGIVACAALLLNLLFLVALVKLIKQPLTLTGIAGIVLTVGMSVDANVLIFERIREELARGASLRMAIRNGFDRATTTIVDANLTTLITALVLYVIGTEQIKGFSITLIIGILVSMFTAIFCSRVVFELGERKGIISKLSMLKIMDRRDWDFVGQRGKALVVSAAVILIGLGAVVFRGVTILDHDLRGGTTARVVFKESSPLTLDSVRKTLNEYDYTIPTTGEKITFTVSELNENTEDLQEGANLRLKIDSNLPIQERDPEEGEEPIRKLEDILVELFGDEMERPEVKFDASAISVAALGQQPGANDALGLQTFDQNSNGPSWRNRLVMGALNSTLTSAISMDSIQDDRSQEKQGDENQAGGATTGNQTGQGSNVSTPPGSSPGSNPVENQGAEDPQTGGETNAPSKRFTASSDLEFKFSTSRGDVKSGLLDVAAKNGIVVLERNIKLSPLEAKGDDFSPRFKDKKWKVELVQLIKKEDAAAVLAAYQNDLNSQPYLPTVSGVGGQIAGRTQWQALAAIVASLIGIITYVWIRFQNVAFGLAAVVALIHDVLVVLGAIAVSVFVADYLGFLLIDNFKISLPVVAAFLTIIGYSLNDTIVVFDRIREVRGKRTDLTSEMINQSISQTLSRTILTSLTTFMVVFIMFLLGGQAIHGFAFALVVGVIVGTYSSIFVASPTLLFLMNRTSIGSIGEEDPATAS